MKQHDLILGGEHCAEGLYGYLWKLYALEPH